MNFFPQFLILTSIFINACNPTNHTDQPPPGVDTIKTFSDTTVQVKDTTILPVPSSMLSENNISLSAKEMKDDSVFDDGSIPTEWKVAGITNVKGLKLFIKKLQVLSSADDKNELAKHIRYPLPNKKANTPKDFVAQYNKLFNQRVKNSLASVNFNQIFRNYQGVMIGNGQLWIKQFGKDFKIITINN